MAEQPETKSVHEDVKLRLGALESHSASMESRMDNVETMLRAHNRKLDQVIQAVASKKTFEPAIVISFIKDMAILIGLGGAGIIYIATNIADKPVSLLDQRIGAIEKHLAPMERKP